MYHNSLNEFFMERIMHVHIKLKILIKKNA